MVTAISFINHSWFILIPAALILVKHRCVAFRSSAEYKLN